MPRSECCTCRSKNMKYRRQSRGRMILRWLRMGRSGTRGKEPTSWEGSIQFKEYPLKTAGSGPHGLVADKDGNIWFTAISGGYVGKLDPKSGEITEYKPTDGSEIDPHTPVFDHDGILWFTNEDT